MRLSTFLTQNIEKVRSFIIQQYKLFKDQEEVRQNSTNKAIYKIIDNPTTKAQNFFTVLT